MNFEWMKTALQSRSFVLATASLVSAAAGATGAYLVLNKRLEKKYEDLANEEIRQAREMYAKRYKAEQFADVPVYEDRPVVVDVAETELAASDLLEAAAKIAEEQKYTPYNNIGARPKAQSEEERVEVMASQTRRNNIFEGQGIVETEDYDRDKELTKREQGLPYIIEDTEFYENDDNKQQFTFTYYEEDDVLLDETDSPIDHSVIDRNLGLDNLRFGYGSTNKNTVLIHNPNSDNQYEIVRNVGSYAREFLGFDSVEEEYEDNRPRKFRQDD